MTWKRSVTSSSSDTSALRWPNWKQTSLRPWIKEFLKRHPERFRRQIALAEAPERAFHELVQPWQARDFAALDRAWMQLAGRVAIRSSTSPQCRAYIERPRGHSKTSDVALQLLWALFASKSPLNGLAAAADREQANLIHRAMERIAQQNAHYLDDLRFLQNLVRNSSTGSRLDVISSDVRSSWGVLPDFVICDELCHWEKPDLWYSLLSSAAKKPHCVLMILTNAGVGRGWQWNVREHARRSPDWYFSSLEGPHAPWITEEWLAEQRALLPPAVFERLWLNTWQHSDGEFVSLAEAEACRDSQLKAAEQGRPGVDYVAAIDYAEKQDLTVGCLCHREGERVIVDRMDVVRPTPTRPTPVQWVEDWIFDTVARFHRVTFIVDEYQLLGTIQRLSPRYDIRRFPFQAGLGNHRLTLNLRQLILHRQVRWYPDCGAITNDTLSRDDLETELASLVLRTSASGRVRLDHVQDGLHHDDRSFALGVACLHLIEGVAAGDFLEVTLPPSPGGFAW